MFSNQFTLKKQVLFLTLILSCFYSFSQNNIQIYEAYLNEDMLLWKHTMDSLESISNKNEQEIIDVLNYQYGYVAYCISKDKDHLVERYINKAEQEMSILEQKHPDFALIYAYKSAFTGFKISLAPYKAPFLGITSSNYANKSIELDPKNIFGYIQLGNIAYYSPGIFGGSKKEAVKHYLKALKLMEQNTTELQHNWNYLNVLVNIIMSYIKLEQKDLALKYYHKTMLFEPRFKWLKKNVLPQLK